MGQLESFGCDTDVRRADAGHEQCRDKCYDIGLLFSCEVYCDGPKGEYGERLVAPSEVAPDDLKAISIGQAVDERAGRDEE